MAILKDQHYRYTQTVLEFSLLEKEGDPDDPCYFIEVMLRICFGRDFPVIEEKLDIMGEDVDDMIEQLTLLGNREIFNVNFYPLEPCFEMQILHSGRGKYEKENRYEFTWFLCVGRTDYHSNIGLKMDTKYELIKAFADELRNERIALDQRKE